MGEREFRDGEPEDWKLQTGNGFDIVELSNRYFRPSKSTNNEENILISQDVDQMGILTKMAQRRWIHMEDNIIQYYTGIFDKRDKKKYVPAKPQTFRVGDVVKAQCSKVFMKMKDDMPRMKTILRALALVNCDQSTKANMDRRNTADTQLPLTTRNKRKIGFEEDDDVEGEYAGVKKANVSRVDEVNMATYL